MRDISEGERERYKRECGRLTSLRERYKREGKRYWHEGIRVSKGERYQRETPE